MSSANIPHTQVQGLEECFKLYEHPFVDHEMNYQQIQYYKNNFNLIVSSYVCVLAYNNCGTVIRSLSELYLVSDMFGKELVLSNDVCLKETVSCM